MTSLGLECKLVHLAPPGGTEVIINNPQKCYRNRVEWVLRYWSCYCSRMFDRYSSGKDGVVFFNKKFWLLFFNNSSLLPLGLCLSCN